MSSPPISEISAALNGSDAVDRTSLPLRLYTPSDARLLTNVQLNNIMVPQLPDNKGNNVFCRECEDSFKSTLQSNKRYFKRDNLIKHLIHKHQRQEPAVQSNQSTLPLSFFDKNATYLLFRQNLLKSIIYKYIPFQSTDYPFSVVAFQYIGYDPPCRTSISNDIKDCAALVFRVLQYLFSIISLFSIEFDLWSSPRKAVLSLVVYFLANSTRHKLVLDTLPLLDGTTHNAESYSQTIKKCLQNYDLESPSRVVRLLMAQQ